MADKLITFESSTVWLEVQRIIASSDGAKLFDYKGVLHTEKEDIGVWDLNPIITECDYLKNYGETKKIQFKIGLGDYIARLFPFRDNLEFTIKRTPMGDSGTQRKKNSTILVTRYKAIFNPKNNPSVGASDLQLQHLETLNISDMVEVQIELLERSLEPLRIKTTSGAYQNQTMEALLRSVIGHETQQVLVDGKPSIDALEIVPPDNGSVIPHVILADGTELMNLTTFLQKDIGIYNRGIGTYYKKYNGKRTLFVYPTYDTSRANGNDVKAVFYAVPQEKLPQLDRSCMVDGNIVKIAVTAQRLYTDSAELAMMNKGNGFRMADAGAFMKKPVQYDDNGPKANRARVNNEMVIKNRKDGLDYAKVVNGGPSSNPYFQKSLIWENTLGQIDLVWENADEELIYPGMPCKYVYLSHGKAVTVNGTILFMHVLTSRIEKFNTQAYRTSVRLSLAVEPFSHIPDIDFQGVKGEINTDVVN